MKPARRGGAVRAPCGRRKYQAFTMADETKRLHCRTDNQVLVANTKPLRWLMKPFEISGRGADAVVANTKPLRWLMKPVGRDDRCGLWPGRKYQAFTMADETCVFGFA